MGGSFSSSVGEYFLFTILGFIMTYDHAFVFGAGDGVFALNGAMTVLTPHEGNAPEYLAYGLVETDRKGPAPMLKVVGDISISKLESILIGTDGVKDLIDAAEKKIPGKTDKVGSISQFWQDDRIFRNPFTIHRRLNLINRTV